MSTSASAKVFVRDVIEARSKWVEQKPLYICLVWSHIAELFTRSESGNYNVAMPVVSIILNVLSSHLVKILSKQRKIVVVEAGERQHHNLRPHARKVD